jgi:hypothetical protein
MKGMVLFLWDNPKLINSMATWKKQHKPGQLWIDRKITCRVKEGNHGKTKLAVLHLGVGVGVISLAHNFF